MGGRSPPRAISTRRRSRLAPFAALPVGRRATCGRGARAPSGRGPTYSVHRATRACPGSRPSPGAARASPRPAAAGAAAARRTVDCGGGGGGARSGLGPRPTHPESRWGPLGDAPSGRVATCGRGARAPSDRGSTCSVRRATRACRGSRPNRHAAAARPRPGAAAAPDNRPAPVGSARGATAWCDGTAEGESALAPRTIEKPMAIMLVLIPSIAGGLNRRWAQSPVGSNRRWAQSPVGCVTFITPPRSRRRRRSARVGDASERAGRPVRAGRGAWFAGDQGWVRNRARIVFTPAPGNFIVTLRSAPAPLPGAHLADTERRVPQLGADLQPGSGGGRLFVVLDDELAGLRARRAGVWPGGACAPRRHVRELVPARCSRRLFVAAPAAAPRSAPLARAVGGVLRRPRHHDRLDGFHRQIAQESAGDAGQLLPREPAATHARKVQQRAGPRDGDVAEAALLLDGRVVVDRCARAGRSAPRGR